MIVLAGDVYGNSFGRDETRNKKRQTSPSRTSVSDASERVLVRERMLNFPNASPNRILDPPESIRAYLDRE